MGVASGDLRALAVQRREIHELVDDTEARVEPSLLGQIPEGAPREIGRWRAVPAHFPVVRVQDPEADPHRRGLARAIGAEEAEDPTTGHAERELVERDGLPEPLRAR